MTKTAAFRTDASPTIGSGHVMRCLTLADALTTKGWDCCFFTNQETIDTVPALKESPYETVFSPTDAIFDLLIVDHYDLDHQFETVARTLAKKILVIDDLANRKHDCDFLIDQTYGRNADDYLKLVPDKCKILTGAQYALLRPQFKDMRNESLLVREGKAGKISDVMVSLGGTNVHNITGSVLHALASYNHAKLVIHVVLSPQARDFESIRTKISSMNDTGLHQVKSYPCVTNMAELMTGMDIAIGAAGTTSWERCTLGLPTLLINVADNQDKIAAELTKARACELIGSYKNLTADKIKKALRDLQQHPDTVYAMGKKAATICDGKGVDRVVQAIGNSNDRA